MHKGWNPSPRRRELFWRWVKIGEPNECWPWMLPLSDTGYGHSAVDHWRTTAHRIAYALRFGLFDNSLVVRHKCDNPACCNPNHLRLGTQLENMRDMHEKGRAGDCRVFGESHGRCKLSDRQIGEIHAMRSSGKSQQAIADHFKVGQSQIGRILRGENRRSSSRP